MKLTFGTTNSAKILQLAGVLAPAGIELAGLERKIEVAEDGLTAEENARKKAVTYASVFRRTILSMDNALYIAGLPDSEQPGVHVRRINGKEAVLDEPLIAHYSALAARHGGTLQVRWHFALAIATPEGRILEETIITPPRELRSLACAARQPGYPLESLQIDALSGKYVAELSPDEQDAFWRRTIGVHIAGFVVNALKELGG